MACAGLAAREFDHPRGMNKVHPQAEERACDNNSQEQLLQVFIGHQQDQERPEDIELFLHRQGPEVVEKIGIPAGRSREKEIIHIEKCILDLIQGNLHVAWPVGERDQPGGDDDDQEQVENNRVGKYAGNACRRT